MDLHSREIVKKETINNYEKDETNDKNYSADVGELSITELTERWENNKKLIRQNLNLNLTLIQMQAD